MRKLPLQPLTIRHSDLIAVETIDSGDYGLHVHQVVLAERDGNNDVRSVWPDELIERIAQRVVDKLEGRLLEKV